MWAEQTLRAEVDVVAQRSARLVARRQEEARGHNLSSSCSCSRVVAGHSAPGLEMAISFPAMFVVFVVTFSAPWWVARRNRRHQEEIDRWRQWMDEQHL